MSIILEYFPILFFIITCFVLLLGYPVSFSLAGVSLVFALIAISLGIISPTTLYFFPQRIFGIMSNTILIAIPLFIFMGVMLERSKLAEELINAMGKLLGSLKGGIAYSVVIVGMLMAASTGIVGATVVTMGLLSLPSMLKHQYSPSFSSGLITASGTLGQIIPPSIILVLLADVISNANQESQRSLGIFNGQTISVSDLFSGAIIPGLLLVLCYLAYIMIIGLSSSKAVPKKENSNLEKLSYKELLQALLPSLGLILAVLGSILIGVATPTEAAALGAIGASLIAALKLSDLKQDRRALKLIETGGLIMFVLLLTLFFVFLVTKTFMIESFLTLFLQGMCIYIMILSLLCFIFGLYYFSNRFKQNKPFILIVHWFILSALFGLIALFFIPYGFQTSLDFSDMNLFNQFINIVILTICFSSFLGSMVSFLLLFKKQILIPIITSTAKITSMIFIILIGASLFSLIFKSSGGNDLIHNFLVNLPGGKLTAFITVMGFIFLLGFILDTIEITYVVIPMIAVPLISMGFNPVWLGVVIAVNLQTSFLTPPFGFALFYFRGVAPPSIKTTDIYKGVIPFIIIQVFVLTLISLFPDLVTFLPNQKL